MAGQSPVAAEGKKSGRLGGMLSSLTSKAQSQFASLDVSGIPHTLRQAQATYDPRQSSYTLKLQLLIKAQKGVVLDTEALGRESHSFSKQLYLWSLDQEGEDLKDVGDRLAFLTYKSGDLQMEYSKAVEKARAEMKDIRNFENDLTKPRDRRKVLEIQLARLAAETKPRADHAERVSAANSELHSIQREAATYEASLEALKRRKLRSAFAVQFAAMRELGEKFALLSGFGEELLEELDAVGDGGGTTTAPTAYGGKDRTALIRGAAADALANYKGPLISPARRTSELSRANTDTRSFGETHRHELASLSSPALGEAHSTPGSTTFPTAPHAGAQQATHAQSFSSVHSGQSPLSPAGAAVSGVNHTPASAAQFSPPLPPTARPVPTPHASEPTGTAMSDDSVSPPPVGANPTIAEVGGKVPTTTGGPASGQLPPRRASAESGRRLAKVEEAAQESAGGETGLGRMASTSRKSEDEPLPAYSIEEGAEPPTKPEKS